MRTGRFRLGMAAVFLASSVSGWAAGTIILRIRAGNPIDKPQTIHIKSNLPQRVTTNDIVNLGGLELGYDVKSGVYYVHRVLELAPKAAEEFRVDQGYLAYPGRDA